MQHNGVFWVTVAWSTFAYVWLYLILSFFSPGVVEVRTQNTFFISAIFEFFFLSNRNFYLVQGMHFSLISRSLEFLHCFNISKFEKLSFRFLELKYIIFLFRCGKASWHSPSSHSRSWLPISLTDMQDNSDKGLLNLRAPKRNEKLQVHFWSNPIICG